MLCFSTVSLGSCSIRQSASNLTLVLNTGSHCHQILVSPSCDETLTGSFPNIFKMSRGKHIFPQSKCIFHRAISCVYGTEHNAVFFELQLIGTQLMAGMYAGVRLWQFSVLALIHKLVKMKHVGLLDTPKYLGCTLMEHVRMEECKLAIITCTPSTIMLFVKLRLDDLCSKIVRKSGWHY